MPALLPAEAPLRVTWTPAHFAQAALFRRYRHLVCCSPAVAAEQFRVDESDWRAYERCAQRAPLVLRSSLAQACRRLLREHPLRADGHHELPVDDGSDGDSPNDL